ncbi:MAG: hypothetical protein WKG06_20620 [Segetibacter sp.]
MASSAPWSSPRPARDGEGGTDTKTFTVTVTQAVANRLPVLDPIADRTVPATQDLLSVSLSASDPDGDPVGFTATAQSLAYVLDQQLGAGPPRRRRLLPRLV